MKKKKKRLWPEISPFPESHRSFEYPYGFCSNSVSEKGRNKTNLFNHNKDKIRFRDNREMCKISSRICLLY